MAVKIRLMRMGAKDQPFYRIVVAHNESPRDGRFIEIIGYYDVKRDPPEIKFDVAKLKKWLDNGAIPTKIVKDLMRKAKVKEQLEALNTN